MKASSVWEETPCSGSEDRYAAWICIFDPCEYSMTGGRFGFYEIYKRYENSVWDCWVPGTKFQHAKTKKIIEIFQTKKYFNRKNRIYSTTMTRFRYVKPTDQLELDLQ